MDLTIRPSGQPDQSSRSVRFAGALWLAICVAALCSTPLLADRVDRDAGSGVFFFCPGVDDGAGGSLELYVTLEVASPSNPGVPPPDAFFSWTDGVSTYYDIAFDAQITADYERRVLTATIPLVAPSSEPAGDAQIVATLTPIEPQPSELSIGVQRQGNLIFGKMLMYRLMTADVSIALPDGRILRPTGCLAEEFSGHFVFNNPTFWVKP
jgi:hypothetical protein